MRILIVEDEKFWLASWPNQLRLSGFVTDLATMATRPVSSVRPNPTTPSFSTSACPGAMA